jgi:3-phosphoshikimate 1-carboxyvinyltransferase
VTSIAPPGPPDELVVEGGAPLRGTVVVPGDKGIAHRALLVGALADGPVRIDGLPGGQDVAATVRLLRACGVPVAEEPAGVRIEGPATWREPGDVLDCGNSGTTIRLAAGVLAGRDGCFAVLTGDASLRRRPMGRVVRPLRAMGARIDGRARGERAPLAVRGGALRGVTHHLEVASGQVKTALLLAGLGADGATEVVEPAPSRDHTERLLGALGAPVEQPTETRVHLRPAAIPGFALRVPGDPSSAAYWVVAATLVPGSRLELPGLSTNPGRLGWVRILQDMGAAIEVTPTTEELGEPVGALSVEAARLHGRDVEVTEPIIDEVPVLAVAAAFAEGTTTFRGAAELAVKESDRIATTTALLAALGVEAEARRDGLVVHGGRPRPGRVDAAGDHRLALAGAVAGLALPGRTVVAGWSAHAVSYPGFTAALAALRGSGRGDGR